MLRMSSCVQGDFNKLLLVCREDLDIGTAQVRAA